MHGAVRRRISLGNFIWIMRNKIENEDLAEMQDPFLNKRKIFDKMQHAGNNVWHYNMGKGALK